MSGDARVRDDLPFRRIALVLSGGGALGAYEVGVLRVLEALGLKPRIIAGVSVGAINAVIWVAHGFRSEILRETWRKLRPPSLGIRWTTLAARALGGFVVALAAFEALTALANLPPLGLLAHSRLRQPRHLELQSVILETLSWAALAGLGVAIVLLSPRLEDLLVRFAKPDDPGRGRRWFSRGLLILAALYVATAPFEIPWPRRFHTTLLVAGGLAWVLTRRGGGRVPVRRLVLRLFPETRGRGLWRSGGRRRLLEELIARGDGERLLTGETHLILSACAIDSGRMHYFVNWLEPSAEFRQRIAEALGEVTLARSVRAIIHAAVASSAVPVVFEPERIHGRDFLDGGVFSNQPLHAVIADEADALLLVLVSPSDSPPRLEAEPTLMEVAARLPQLSNWRDLQAELRGLPPQWTRTGDPARVCVIEPAEALPGSLLGFDPENAEELMRRGEADAWRALEQAGWTRPETPAPAP